ncbi:MAG: hypothetical protein A2606_03610 [Candidatus Yanofskybacteria bacterium RIFOXYD1_FULL_42_10]|uniref:Uncharacterized protein n=1 Tax=Candidatus Yanofskybacteria bacterium RIFOXYD1_FULL_42_10 TaxID=1802718 RepID=A0A1F8HTN0_9BACT|nr:MAG: Glycosyl transferase [Candidatus Levybacteria bacterium GW2011_GWC2_40_7]OGN40937.1 MAG: hypothetical protein A2606_03610 [Candidatus Yanofskybacteria bacterium RIFOXYD1_FULL_42_10]
MKTTQTLYRGGGDTERLYLRNLTFTLKNGVRVVVKKSRIATSALEMERVISRHHSRYNLVGVFCRPGIKVMDVPCGSGYASSFLRTFGVTYLGVDIDQATIAYANKIYGDKKTKFKFGDLTTPNFGSNQFDVISCIEGLEHIERKYQSPLIAAFKKALKPNGILVITSPENPSGKSGVSQHNPDHLWELTGTDFLKILKKHFGANRVECFTQDTSLTTGVTTINYFGICHNKQIINK